MEKTYKIADRNISWFEEKIEKMNKRIQKIGKRTNIEFPVITYTIGELQKEKKKITAKSSFFVKLL